MRSRSTLLLACVAVAALRASPALADAATEAKLRDALRSTTSQLRALEDERARWQADQAALQQEVQALKRDVAAARSSSRGASRSDARIAELELKLAEQGAAGAASAAELAECRAESARSSAAASAQGAELSQAKEQAKQLGEGLAAAQARNARMYAVGRELIDWLQGKGVGAALAAREPFLGLKRVELENAVDQYEDRLAEQRAGPQAK